MTAIELPSRLAPSSAYASLPALESLHARLAVDEATLLRLTGGSFSLGYSVATAGEAPFFLAHGVYGAPIAGGEFFPHWVKARQFGLNAALEDFSPTAMAARHGRILLPDAETEAFGRTDYSYHLPAIAYAAMLKSHAHRIGVAIHQTVHIGVDRDGETGAVRAIFPDDDTAVVGDLFVDASGTDAVLLGATLGVGSDDWRTLFPLDRRLTGLGKCFASVPAYAELRVSLASWTALYASQAATHVVHAYHSEDADEEAAIATAAQTCGMALSDIVITATAPGIRKQAWSGNCVAIGASACAFDPLFDLDLHAVQLGIVHLLSLFPATSAADAERAEYNRITRSLFERLRDFQAALYLLAGASTAEPPSLVQKFEIFRARGSIAPMEDETFTSDQWRALFVGCGLLPESWPPAIDATPPERMKQGFRGILAFVRAKVLEQPTQDRYLADIGAHRAS